ncbi:hypothetical protein EGW08_000189 [Elysia chlorotica]|uniref:Sulfotransferase domain-containing protein n=1 Tax=Elysia chlorotica TaxID=188477 RepID=A0A3S1BV72_ELYCH|nr:hypothetical protein EGW08_000189 [Elysia chlorotica]
MRLMTKAATRWQLLRLISVWGATLLCLYCITIGTNFRESFVHNRLANEVYKRNLTNAKEEKGNTARPVRKAALFKSELSTATPDSDPFDPPLSASSDGRGETSPAADADSKYQGAPIFMTDIDSKEETEKTKQPEPTQLLFSKLSNSITREEGEKEIRDDKGYDEDENSEYEKTSEDDKPRNSRNSEEDDGDKRDKEEDEEKEERKEERGDDEDDEDDEDDLKAKKDDRDTAVGTRNTGPKFESSLSRQNEELMKTWFTDHLRINGTIDWWEHMFPVWKMDLDPDAMGPFKTANWPWVTLEVGHYDPKLFTHPPGELPRQRMPKVIIFGAGKCGTRALVEFLKLHPNIASTRAEVHYFDENLDKGLEWYMARMPLSFSNQMTLEKSPSYLWEPRAPEELYKINKDVKLILLVKDPVDRIMSQAARMVNTDPHNYQSDTPRHFYLERINGSLSIKKWNNAVNRGKYIVHLKKWLRFFPLSQIHVLDGGALKYEPATQIQQVETFLGLPPLLGPSNFYYNATKGFYCMVPFSTNKPSCLGKSKGRKHPQLNDTVKTLLYDFYRPYNEEFFRVLGRRFDWEPKDYT